MVLLMAPTLVLLLNSSRSDPSVSVRLLVLDAPPPVLMMILSCELETYSLAAVPGLG